MNINLQNYEAYFIDYLEGQLDETTISELKDFLASNPQLQKVLKQYSPVSIKPYDVLFNKKASLYKLKFDETPINDHTYNDFCIAYYENLLNDTKKAELLNFIETNPEFKNNFLLYKKTYLPPEIIVYPEHERLYKKGVSKRPVLQIYTWWSIAAGVIIIFGIYFGYLINLPDTQTTISYNSMIQPKDIVKQNEEKINTTPAFTETKRPTSAKNESTTVIHQPTVAIENTVIEKEPNMELLEPIPGQLLVNTSVENNLGITDFALYQNIGSIATFGKPRDTINSPNYDLERKRYFLLSLVETSLNQINRISRTDFADVSFKTDKSGKIIAYSVRAGFIEFHRNKEKN